jgi:GTP-binding protein
MEFEGRRIDLVDTGGFIDETLDPLADQVRRQIDLAVDAADVVLFLVDARTGITYDDLQIARRVQRTSKPVLLLANKSERPQDREDLMELRQLGLGISHPISAATGYGMDGLVERLRKMLPPPGQREMEPDDRIRVAILGRPNAGKSTLMNRLLGEERMIVADLPGTTRDSVDAEFTWQGQKFVVTDTAGLRKKSKVSDDVEYYSNMRSIESIRRSHVVILLIDGQEGLPEQDLRILRQIEEAGKGLVVGLSKWDAVVKDHKTFDDIVKEFRYRIKALEETPIVSFSSHSGQRVPKLLEEVIRVRKSCLSVFGREKVIEYFENCLVSQSPPHVNGKLIRLKRCCQVHVDPPMLAFETDNPDMIPESYRRFLRTRAIEKFELTGVPLRIAFRDRLELRSDEDLMKYAV